LVAEETIAITDLRLGDLIETTVFAGNFPEDETRLRFLSLAPHSYFDGNTRVFGNLRLEGPEDERIEEVALDIIQGGSVRGSAGLSPQAADELLNSFGPDGVLEVPETARLFEFDPAALSGINLTTDGTVSLQVRVKGGSSDKPVREEAGSVGVFGRTSDELLVYGDEDREFGGRKLAQSSMVAIAEAWPADLFWNDFSKMNGGHSHRTAATVRGLMLMCGFPTITIATPIQRPVSSTCSTAAGARKSTLWASPSRRAKTMSFTRPFATLFSTTDARQTR